MTLEHLVLDRVELVPDLVEDREAVVEEVVEHLVEEAARPLGEQLLPQPLVVLFEVLLAKDPVRRFQTPAELLKVMPTVMPTACAPRCNGVCMSLAQPP